MDTENNTKGTSARPQRTVGVRSRERQPLVELPEVATVAEVAVLLRVSRATVYEAVQRGELPALRIGRRVLFPERS